MFGAAGDLIRRERAQRMIDRHDVEIVHAEDGSLRARFTHELRGDDNRSRNLQFFQAYCVARTARRTGPSICDGDHCHVVIRGDFPHELRRGGFSESLFLVTIHVREADVARELID